MNQKITGKISFIHHEKNRAVIEYMANEKKKTIQADLNSDPGKEKTSKLSSHRFMVGDTVSFTIKKTGSKGQILYANHVTYLYNTELEMIINQARVENKFLGYIKITEKDYFIKEINSYLFFPLKISSFELPPAETESDKPITFKLINLDNPNKIMATLYNHHYVAGFENAVQSFKKNLVVDASVYKLTPYGVHVWLFDKDMKAKLAITGSIQEKITTKEIDIGSVIPVKIRFISASKIDISAEELL